MLLGAGVQRVAGEGPRHPESTHGCCTCTPAALRDGEALQGHRPRSLPSCPPTWGAPMQEMLQPRSCPSAGLGSPFAARVCVPCGPEKPNNLDPGTAGPRDPRTLAPQDAGTPRLQDLSTPGTWHPSTPTPQEPATPGPQHPRTLHSRPTPATRTPGAEPAAACPPGRNVGARFILRLKF